MDDALERASAFAKKLYSLYLSYLPADKFKYALKMNVDNRGSFTELVHTEDCGQVSINIISRGLRRDSIGIIPSGSFSLLLLGTDLLKSVILIRARWLSLRFQAIRLRRCI